MPDAVQTRRRRPRAAALPPDERRAAIVDVTLQLLVERGPSVTTKQIAEAAGIAEGTIFHVFADKEAVLQAAVDRVLDPTAVEAELAAIDRALPFDEQLAAAVAVVQERITRIWQVCTTVGPLVSMPRKPVRLPGLVALFEAQRDHLRCSPARGARLLRGLIVTMSHPELGSDDGAPATPQEIATFLLDGIRTPADAAGRRDS